jgi:hypothetical protein
MSARRRRVLVVGGSLNQTSMLARVAAELAADCDCTFTPFYADGILRHLAEAGWLDFTILAGQARQRSLEHVSRVGLAIDPRGARGGYDLALLGTDLAIPRNLSGIPFVLVQEGMTDPEDWRYHLVRRLRLPRFLANTSMTGLSHAYARFCVASEGYRDLFERKGVRRERMVVTGMPNFDEVDAARDNDFPHRGYVLAATSCLRETLKPEDRRGFIRNAVRIAGGRPLLFKLHPNENVVRARREIEREVPQAMVLAEGNTLHMVANCEALVTRYSTVLLWALALGKEVHSDLPAADLARLAPLQTGGRSALRIAEVCREVMAA